MGWMFNLPFLVSIGSGEARCAEEIKLKSVQQNNVNKNFIFRVIFIGQKIT
jgi:hypothetical protein